MRTLQRVVAGLTLAAGALLPPAPASAGPGPVPARWPERGVTASGDDLSFGPLSAVAAGGAHTCALGADGEIYCWGANGSGQLGDGTTTGATTARPVHPGELRDEGLMQLDAGGAHTCVVDLPGDVYCWGDDSSGQLGVGGGAPLRTEPIGVGGALAGATIVKVATGGAHTCALTDAGDVFCWGENSSGQLGDGTTGPAQNSPVLIGAGSPLAGAIVVDLAANGEHTCAILDTGTAHCWGANGHGQLGDGTTTGRTLPTTVTGGAVTGRHLTTIAAGRTSTCATDDAGRAYCWGDDTAGALGNGAPTGADSPTPVTVTLGDESIDQLTAGNTRACGLTATLTALCWGAGAAAPATLPPPPATSLSEVDTLADHSCAGTYTGAVYCWGANASGQLGDASTTDRSTPVAVHGLPVGPTAPRGVRATARDRGLTVAWSPPATLGTGTLTGYVALAIDRRDFDTLQLRHLTTMARAATTPAAPGARGDGDGTCVAVGRRTCTLTGLTNGADYVLIVLTWTSVGFSAPSEPTVARAGRTLPATGTTPGRWAAAGATLLLSGLALTLLTRRRPRSASSRRSRDCAAIKDL